MAERDPFPIALCIFVIAIGFVAMLQIGAPGSAIAVAALVPALILGIMILSKSPSTNAPPPALADNVPHTESAILNGISDPLLIVTNGQVEQANPPATALLGRHIIGQDLRLAIRHPDLVSVDHLDRVELQNVNGRDLNLLLSFASLGDGRRMIHISDRTEKQLVERARGDFVANASHELRTPLASIIGYAETLSDFRPDDDPAMRARFISIIADEARRMHQLVDELISLSRIEAERYEPPATAISLRSLILETAEEWRDAQGKQRQGLVLDLPEGVPSVLGDAGQLKQVINNLVGNAFRYGSPPITITIAAIEGHAQLTVSDHGDGIAPDHLPRITERFYRVDPSRSRMLGGTGLGLSIVKHIVERHRGRLDIRSKVGVGTTIIVTLPTLPQALS